MPAAILQYLRWFWCLVPIDALDAVQTHMTNSASLIGRYWNGSSVPLESFGSRSNVVVMGIIMAAGELSSVTFIFSEEPLTAAIPSGRRVVAPSGLLVESSCCEAGIRLSTVVEQWELGSTAADGDAAWGCFVIET